MTFVSSFLTLPFRVGNEQETNLETPQKVTRVPSGKVETGWKQIIGIRLETGGGNAGFVSSEPEGAVRSTKAHFHRRRVTSKLGLEVFGNTKEAVLVQ